MQNSASSISKSANEENNSGARPKLMGALKTVAARVVQDQIVQRDEGEMTPVMMNWQGRYRALNKNSPALKSVNTGSDIKKDDYDMQMSKVLSKAQHNMATAMPSAATEPIGGGGPHASKSELEQRAMKQLFGEEITPQHINLFAILKKAIAKWRSRAAQRKNIVAVEHFATNELQRRAIIRHKEQAVINLPMPINWAIKEEALAVLADVVKVYRKEFGNNHKLTVDARKRIDKLRADVSRP